MTCELMRGFEAEVEKENIRLLDLARKRDEMIKQEELQKIEKFKKLVEV
jgi:hypothetical protein